MRAGRAPWNFTQTQVDAEHPILGAAQHRGDAPEPTNRDSPWLPCAGKSQKIWDTAFSFRLRERSLGVKHVVLRCSCRHFK